MKLKPPAESGLAVQHWSRENALMAFCCIDVGLGPLIASSLPWNSSPDSLVAQEFARAGIVLFFAALGAEVGAGGRHLAPAIEGIRDAWSNAGIPERIIDLSALSGLVAAGIWAIENAHSNLGASLAVLSAAGILATTLICVAPKQSRNC